MYKEDEKKLWKYYKSIIYKMRNYITQQQDIFNCKSSTLRKERCLCKIYVVEWKTFIFRLKALDCGALCGGWDEIMKYCVGVAKLQFHPPTILSWFNLELSHNAPPKKTSKQNIIRVYYYVNFWKKKEKNFKSIRILCLRRVNVSFKVSHQKNWHTFYHAFIFTSLKLY